MLPVDHATVLILLMAAPRRIARASRGLNDKQLRRKPAPDSWSANEVLAHLRASADVWGRSIAAMLAQDHPTFRYVSPRTWIRKTNYTTLDFGTSFQEYAKQRKDLLKVLRTLRNEDWLRGATVKADAKHREETVLSYAQRLAQHEARHCEQVERILDSLEKMRRVPQA